MRDDPPAATRRTALTGAVALVGLAAAAAGCDTDDLRPHDAVSPSPSTGKPTVRTPDARLVADVAAAVRAGLVLALRGGHSAGVGGTSTRFARMHQAQLASLDRALHQRVRPLRLTSPAARDDYLSRLVTSERHLAPDLATAAVRAQSGALARLLGSMSAGETAHLTAYAGVPDAPTSGGGNAAPGPSPSPSPSVGATVGAEGVAALQRTLAAEHAAVYLDALLGARTSESSEPVLYAALRKAYEDHRAQRDALTSELAAAGSTPVAAAPAYRTPSGIDTAQGVERAALRLERGCATTYAALVAATTGTRRAAAVADLTRAAVRELAFRGTPEIFPGAAEYADR